MTNTEKPVIIENQDNIGVQVSTGEVQNNSNFQGEKKDVQKKTKTEIQEEKKKQSRGKIWEKTKGESEGEAVTLWKDWIKNYIKEYGEDQNTLYAKVRLGDIYYRLQKNNEAIEYYESALEQYKESENIRLRRFDLLKIYRNLSDLYENIDSQKSEYYLNWHYSIFPIDGNFRD